MIPQNELRIGNFVFKDKQRIPTSEGSIFSAELHTIDEYSFYESTSLDPIRITEEWLIRLGFEKGSPNAYATNYYIAGFCVSRHFKDGLYYSWTANINYVHQLQNLYFAITGKELELKQNA